MPTGENISKEVDEEIIEWNYDITGDGKDEKILVYTLKMEKLYIHMDTKKKSGIGNIYIEHDGYIRGRRMCQDRIL